MEASLDSVRGRIIPVAFVPESTNTPEYFKQTGLHHEGEKDPPREQLRPPESKGLVDSLQEKDAGLMKTESICQFIPARNPYAVASMFSVLHPEEAQGQTARPRKSSVRKKPTLSTAAQRTLGKQVPGSALEQPDPAIPVVEEIGPTVLLKLEIEGIPVEAIGDTGAQSVLLPQWCVRELIEKHGQEWWDGRWKSSDAYFESATGHPTVTGGIHFLTINDGYTRVVVPCHVHCESYTQEKSSRSRVLLGTNALRGLGFLMTSASGELVMTSSHYQVPLTIFVDTEEGTQQVYSGNPCTNPMGDGWPTESIRQREGNPDIPAEPILLPKPKGILSPSRTKTRASEKLDVIRISDPKTVSVGPHSGKASTTSAGETRGPASSQKEDSGIAATEGSAKANSYQSPTETSWKQAQPSSGSAKSPSDEPWGGLLDKPREEGAFRSVSQGMETCFTSFICVQRQSSFFAYYHYRNGQTNSGGGRGRNS